MRDHVHPEERCHLCLESACLPASKYHKWLRLTVLPGSQQEAVVPGPSLEGVWPEGLLEVGSAQPTTLPFVCFYLFSNSNPETQESYVRPLCTPLSLPATAGKGWRLRSELLAQSFLKCACPLHMCVHTHVRTHMLMCTQAQAYAPMHTHRHMPTRVHTHMFACIYKHMCVHTCTCPHIHAHRYTRTCIHTSNEGLQTLFFPFNE